MAYIANRPVRFDRSYRVGEIIPPKVIEPKMVRKLMDMGRILCVDIPEMNTSTGENTDTPQNKSEETIDSQNVTKDTNTQSDTENELKGQIDTPQDNIEKAADNRDINGSASEEFSCRICGKVFKSQNALSAHSRSHKD